MKNKKFDINAPFPLISKKKEMIFVTLTISVFVYVFLMIFQPFGLDKITYYKPVVILGYAIITMFVVGIGFFLFPVLFKKAADPETWTLKKMLILTSFQIILIAVLNSIYTIIIGKDVIEAQKTVFDFIFITISVSIIPATFLIIFTERLLTVKNQANALKYTERINSEKKETNTNQLIKIGIDNNSISVYLNELVYIKSEGNYIAVYYLENDLLKKHQLRYPISKIMVDFSDYETIKHCHRSYIVNFQHVTSVSGNARNYVLELKHVDFDIPVSRNFSRRIIEKTKLTSAKIKISENQ